MNRNLSPLGMCAAIVIVLVAPFAATAAVVPDFAGATFAPGAPIDHTYLPILDNNTYIYQGEYEPGATARAIRFARYLTCLGGGQCTSTEGLNSCAGRVGNAYPVSSFQPIETPAASAGRGPDYQRNSDSNHRDIGAPGRKLKASD